MAASTARARALAILVLAAGLLYAQCGGSKTTTPTPIDPNPTPIPNPNPNPTPSAPVVFVGAGDIGWNPAGDGKAGGQALTAALINGIGGQVFTAGDNAYLDGTLANFTQFYAPSWGQFIGRTRPTPGNHEYDNHSSMPGYFDYFGAAATVGGPGRPFGYYSFEVGDWHAVMLNSSDEVTANSPQGVWLRNDLIAHAGSKCTIAVFHFPLFSSGQNGNIVRMRTLWQILYEANVDVIVNGHDHLYERFAPQDPNGFADPLRGITEFIVGTGGAQLYQFTSSQPNSVKKIGNTYGVLKLTLGTDYRWDFVPVSGGQTDSGIGTCH
jgi:hypothetical protein